MKRITIERYSTPTAGYAGCIEGESDDGTQWIMFLDASGKPEVFWPQRDPDGATAGRAIGLTYEHRNRADAERRARLRNILKDPDPAAVVKRLTAALERADYFVEHGTAEIPERVWELKDQRIFGHEVSPTKPPR